MAGKNNKSMKEEAKKKEGGNTKEEIYTLNQVKDFLKIQEETFTYLIERMEKKMELMKEESVRKEVELKKEIEDLKKSISYATDSCSDYGKKVDKRLHYMDDERRDFGHYIDRRFAELEDRSRRNNLRLDNVEEETENETWEDSERKVKDVISDMGLDSKSIKIERAHRVGSKRVGKKKHRTIVVKFLDYKDREDVMRRYRESKYWEKRKAYINEDYSEYTLNLRKELLARAKSLRANGDYARVIYNRLVHYPKKDNSKHRDAE